MDYYHTSITHADVTGNSIGYYSIAQCGRVTKIQAVGYFRPKQPFPEAYGWHYLDKRFQEGVGITETTISFLNGVLCAMVW